MSRISPVQRGMPVIEGDTNFLSSMFLKWLEFIVARLNKIIIDEKGNIAYGGAPIPTDLNDGFTFEVWPNNVYKMRAKGLGAVYQLTNAYFNSSSQWFQPDTNFPSSLTLQSSNAPTQIIEMRVAAKLQPLQVITWLNCLRFGDDAELHLKSGTVIQFDL